MTRLRHARVEFVLHRLRRVDGPRLLLLHALRGAALDWTAVAPTWPGSVYALDFAGHGGSDWLDGGAYVPEILAADADAALAHVGDAAVAGAGLGAYVALLLAGARPQSVPAALLLPGAGLDGGSSTPAPDEHGFRLSLADAPVAAGGCDPRVGLLEMDVRPPVYAESFARAASRLVVGEDGGSRPDWWEAVRPHAVTVPSDPVIALERLAAIIG
jgi:pimeloyl-ACP methyl ester carboxylesterase